LLLHLRRVDALSVYVSCQGPLYRRRSHRPGRSMPLWSAFEAAGRQSVRLK
jgi:hypothetical protein